MGFPSWWYTVPLRLRSLFRRTRVEQELDEELAYHLEQKTAEYISKGLTPVEARRAALCDMDGLEIHKEECRDARCVNWIEDLARALGSVFRRRCGSPG